MRIPLSNLDSRLVLKLFSLVKLQRISEPLVYHLHHRKGNLKFPDKPRAPLGFRAGLLYFYPLGGSLSGSPSYFFDSLISNIFFCYIFWHFAPKKMAPPARLAWSVSDNESALFNALFLTKMAPPARLAWSVSDNESALFSVLFLTKMAPR